MNKLFNVIDKKEVNTSERTIVAWGSRPVKDRDGERISEKAKWRLENFQKNPVLMMSHDYSRPPVGKILWTKVTEEGLRFKAQFANTEVAKELFELYKDGFMTSFSIGFIANSWEDADNLKENSDGVRRTFTDIELLEVSCVAIPSCPLANLIEASEKGMIKTKEFRDYIDYRKQIEGDSNGKQKETEIQETKEATISGADCISEEKEIMGYDISDEEIEVLNKSLDNYITEDKSIFDELFEEEEEVISPIDEILKSIEIEEKAKPSDEEDEDDDDKVKFCDCESFNGEEDTCKGCGGRRRKPKKSYYEEIIKEYSKLIPEIKKKSIENKEINTKLYDVASVPSSPTSPTSRKMKVYCKFLECQIKDIYQNEFLIPRILEGAYLAGFKDSLKSYKEIDVRNFHPAYDNEYPPSYEVVKINSKIEDDFLMDGQAFYDFSGTPIVLDFFPTYYGQMVVISSSRKNMEVNKNLIKSVHKWVEEKNPLKNEKFSLNREFIDVDPNDNWDTILLDSKNTKIMKITEKTIKEKDNFAGRGILLVGPPGTGKTKVSRILMTQADKTFVWVSSKDLQDTWEAPRQIALGFKLARQLAPTILLFEDIDNWITGKIVDLFKTELDGLKKNTGVVTILTTNNPEKLPDTLLDRPGRFSDVLEFGYPSKDVRCSMLEKWLNVQVKFEETDHWIYDIVKQTEGWSGAHMWELIQFAKSIAEDEEISIEDAILQSLSKLNDQKELINTIRGKSVSDINVNLNISTKEIEEYLENKIDEAENKLCNIEIEEKEFPIEIESKEVEFSDEQIAEIALNVIQEKNLNISNDVAEIVRESILKLKGRMF